VIEKLPDSNAIKSEGPPDKPEDWPRLFEGHLNAGALEAVIALYEPDATIIAPSGETLVGRERIRSLLASMIEAKTCLHSRVVKAVSADGIALLLTDFDGTTGDGSGKTGAIRHKGDRGSPTSAEWLLEANTRRPPWTRRTRRCGTKYREFSCRSGAVGPICA
jgi:hypothetical protein